jgi:hypothetical protein
MEVLQTSALPLGYATAGIFILANFANFTNFVLGRWAENVDLAARNRLLIWYNQLPKIFLCSATFRWSLLLSMASVWC